MSKYDAWKTTPDAESTCEVCGAGASMFRNGWQPDECTGECGIKWRDPDAEYDAMRDDAMERA